MDAQLTKHGYHNSNLKKFMKNTPIRFTKTIAMMFNLMQILNLFKVCKGLLFLAAG